MKGRVERVSGEKTLEREGRGGRRRLKGRVEGVRRRRLKGRVERGGEKTLEREGRGGGGSYQLSTSPNKILF